jgi:hypothetical protein
MYQKKKVTVYDAINILLHLNYTVTVNGNFRVKDYKTIND